MTSWQHNASKPANCNGTTQNKTKHTTYKKESSPHTNLAPAHTEKRMDPRVQSTQKCVRSVGQDSPPRCLGPSKKSGPPHITHPHSPPIFPQTRSQGRTHAKIPNSKPPLLPPLRMAGCWTTNGIALDGLAAQEVTEEAILDLYEQAKLGDEDVAECLSSMLQGITIQSVHQGARWHAQVAEKEESPQVGELLNSIQQVLPLLKWQRCYLGDGIQCVHGDRPEEDPWRSSSRTTPSGQPSTSHSLSNFSA